MFKLIKLEFKKFKFMGNIKGITIANLIIISFLLISIFGTKANNEMIFDTWDDTFLFTSMFVRITFTIYAGVLISKLVIGEYKNKTINILFTYPINRKKVMIAKICIVATFAFIAMIISNIFISSMLYILNIFINFTNEPLTTGILLPNLINIILLNFRRTKSIVFP